VESGFTSHGIFGASSRHSCKGLTRSTRAAVEKNAMFTRAASKNCSSTAKLSLWVCFTAESRYGCRREKCDRVVQGVRWGRVEIQVLLLPTPIETAVMMGRGQYCAKLPVVTVVTHEASSSQKKYGSRKKTR
jgi:hypothetical protein